MTAEDEGAGRPPRRVVAIGECMVELSQGGGGLLRMGFAGDTFNTAWYLKRELGAGFTVAYLSAVGDDKTSDAMLAFMAEGGIDTALVRRLPGRMPGLYLIHLDGAERSFSYWRDTSAARSLADDEHHLDAAFADGDAFYVSGITLAILSKPKRARIVERLGAAKAAGKLVAFDPNIRLRLWPDPTEMREAIEACAAVSTICLPSFPDEAAAFGDAAPAASAKRYLALGAAEVVVKDGAAPALLGEAGRDGLETLPAPPVVDAIDTTGAGDSFGAAYVAARLRGLPPAEAVRCGHRLAGTVVRHHGALIPDDGAIR